MNIVTSQNSKFDSKSDQILIIIVDNDLFKKWNFNLNKLYKLQYIQIQYIIIMIITITISNSISLEIIVWGIRCFAPPNVALNQFCLFWVRNWELVNGYLQTWRLTVINTVL